MTNPTNLPPAIKECVTCKTLAPSNPTPDGDEICPGCGEREMRDYEGEWVAQKLESPEETMEDRFIKEFPEDPYGDFEGGKVLAYSIDSKEAKNFTRKELAKAKREVEFDTANSICTLIRDELLPFLRPAVKILIQKKVLDRVVNLFLFDEDLTHE